MHDRTPESQAGAAATPTVASEGRHASLWVATTPGTAYPALEGALEVDVAVVGGGITGLTTATLLADAGMAVAVVEARRIATGTTGNTTAKATALQGLVYSSLADRLGEETAQVYAEANLAGVELIARLAEELAIDCDLRRRPAVTYAASAETAPAVEAEAQAARRAGLPARLDEDAALPVAVTAAVRLDDQIIFHPRKYCLGLAERLAAAGATLVERTRVTAVEEDGPWQVLVCPAGTVRARHVVLATLMPFPLDGGYFAKAAPSRSYALGARIDGEVPAGMYLSVDRPTRSVRPHPADDGDVLVIEGDAHKTGQDGDPARHYAAVEAWARERFPVVEVTHRWSAQDYTPADGMPYVGRLTSRQEAVLVATGFGKWGMSNGSAAARILADLVLGRDNAWAATFDSTRLNPGASLPDLVKENLNVGKRLIGDRARTALRPRSPDTLAPGEGAVVTTGGEKVAAYRDQQGELHTVSPVCTHMGCEVTWNAAELTWDCPCHGSRFEYDGEVIDGPATRPLERREIG
ncbi:FAD-dependent oxidoreductase [Miltoncostaea marina]|uniref:FAD-dependent oxidoreductase n=1 Tax=Miltoncostaea marina TaxID=2843215 RepID=UPI001C3C430B|nr:FAD-dependent oxidoreductase [Miltoncostaea marina]